LGAINNDHIYNLINNYTKQLKSTITVSYFCINAKVQSLCIQVHIRFNWSVQLFDYLTMQITDHMFMEISVHFSATNRMFQDNANYRPHVIKISVHFSATNRMFQIACLQRNLHLDENCIIFLPCLTIKNNIKIC